MKNFSTYLNKNLRDPELRKRFMRVHYIDDLADQIILLRNERGISQSTLASLANTTQAVVSRVENGSVNSSLNTIQRLAEAMDASIKIDIIRNEEMVIQEYFNFYFQPAELANQTANIDKECVENVKSESSSSCESTIDSQNEINVLFKRNFEKELV